MRKIIETGYVIFLILFSQFRLVANIFQHKDNVLECHLNYSHAFVKLRI